MTTDNGKKHTPVEQFCDALHQQTRDVKAAREKKRKKNITVKTIDDVFFLSFVRAHSKHIQTNSVTEVAVSHDQ